MEWKKKIEDACCADELEEMIIDYIKAGFWSNDEISECCEEYIEDDYPDECDNITEDDFLEIIEALRKEYQNTGNQENFRKLDLAFQSLMKQGIVALHYTGYTQSEGFEDCYEEAEELIEKGEKPVGCCFYTEQDLGHILHEESTLLYLSFGSYVEKTTVEEVGQMIVDALKTAGFNVLWDGTAETKIAIQNFQWDKYYSESE